MNEHLDKLIKEKPVGLERSVGRLISQHVGQENGITREGMLAELHKQSHLSKVKDRHMRMAIQSYREQGVRICHSERTHFDKETRKKVSIFLYYLAANEQEYQEFRARYMEYATTIWSITEAMDKQQNVLTQEGEVKRPKPTEVQGALPLQF